MLSKFALAVKTKTIEFFAEEEEEEEDSASVSAAVDLDPAPEEVITGQRVVVLKPDPKPKLQPVSSKPDPETLVAALFATVSSFRTAYLHLQTAHSPFRPDDIRSADRAAVSHLRRLSDLKRVFFAHNPQYPSQNPQLPDRNPFSDDNSQNPDRRPLQNPNSGPSLPLSSHLEAQVKENQSLLRTLETLVNRLQYDIDRKDAEAAVLKQRLEDLDDANLKLAQMLDRACSPPEEKVETLLSVGVFDSVLRDTCRVTHRFSRILIDLMKNSGWDLDLAANSIYPDVNYAKPGHCRYAILSYICLGMFDGFDSCSFCCDGSGIRLDGSDMSVRRMNSLRQFIKHSTVDPLELLSRSPSCDFAKFCEKKYQKLIHPGMESSLFGNSDLGDSVWGSLRPSSPLYESFVNMASSMWMLHLFAWAYDPVVEIFRVERGTEFSMVYMENIIWKSASLSSDCGKTFRPKVGFTVVPGFRVGKTVIQCRVYLEGLLKEL